jgi:hypothetical protein
MAKWRHECERAHVDGLRDHGKENEDRKTVYFVAERVKIQDFTRI